MDALVLRRPDDWHAHLRDGAMLEAVAPLVAREFGRAVVMPNLSPDPVISTENLRAYRARIEAALAKSRANPPGGFALLMTYYLTDASSPEMLAKGFADGEAYAVKAYPANATTNSAKGVTDIKRVYPVLEAMQKVGMPILLHGETVLENGAEIPAADREKVFLDTTLPTLLKDFPELKVVLEHATTKDAVDFVLGENSRRLASTVTLHHLMVNKEDAARFDNPAYFHCLPVIKTAADQKALRRAATSGNPHFFLGTDSAPHPVSKKESGNPPGGVFTAPAAVEMYAQVFEEEDKLENFEAFASLNGPKFYGLKPNEEKITLTREPWTIDSLVEVSNGEKIRPFGWDEDPAKRLVINWKLSQK